MVNEMVRSSTMEDISMFSKSEFWEHGKNGSVQQEHKQNSPTEPPNFKGGSVEPKHLEAIAEEDEECVDDSDSSSDSDGSCEEDYDRAVVSPTVSPSSSSSIFTLERPLRFDKSYIPQCMMGERYVFSDTVPISLLLPEDRYVSIMGHATFTIPRRPPERVYYELMSETTYENNKTTMDKYHVFTPGMASAAWVDLVNWVCVIRRTFPGEEKMALPPNYYPRFTTCTSRTKWYFDTIRSNSDTEFTLEVDKLSISGGNSAIKRGNPPTSSSSSQSSRKVTFSESIADAVLNGLRPFKKVAGYIMGSSVTSSTLVKEPTTTGWEIFKLYRPGMESGNPAGMVKMIPLMSGPVVRGLLELLDACKSTVSLSPRGRDREGLRYMSKDIRMHDKSVHVYIHKVSRQLFSDKFLENTACMDLVMSYILSTYKKLTKFPHFTSIRTPVIIPNGWYEALDFDKLKKWSPCYSNDSPEDIKKNFPLVVKILSHGHNNGKGRTEWSTIQGLCTIDGVYGEPNPSDDLNNNTTRCTEEHEEGLEYTTEEERYERDNTPPDRSPMTLVHPSLKLKLPKESSSRSQTEWPNMGQPWMLPSLCLISDYPDVGDPDDWVSLINKTHLSGTCHEEAWRSFLFQALSALFVMQHHLGAVHHATGDSSFLCFTNKEDVQHTHWHYIFKEDSVFSIPRPNHVFTLFGFGLTSLNFSNDPKLRRIVSNRDDIEVRKRQDIDNDTFGVENDHRYSCDVTRLLVWVESLIDNKNNKRVIPEGVIKLCRNILTRNTDRMPLEILKRDQFFDPYRMSMSVVDIESEIDVTGNPAYYLY